MVLEIKASIESLKKVLCDDERFYQIPDYQRPYSWDKDNVSDLIADIRTQFKWGSNYTETGELRDETVYLYLKDMTTSHILNILSWDMNKFFKILLSHDNIIINIGFCVTREIFIQELKYRLNDDKY